MRQRMDQRNGTEIVDRDECFRLLNEHQHGVGRIGFVDYTDPVVLPVNYVMDDGRIAFRTAEGSKLEAALNAKSVAFEIDAVDSERNAWSVLVRGRADVVRSDKQKQQLDALGLRTWTDAERTNWVLIWPTTISGRRIPLPPEA